jgi:hypothetical protein
MLDEPRVCLRLLRDYRQPSSPPPTAHSTTCFLSQAEVRALAKKMLRRKVKDDIIEAAYNRYAL